MLRVFAKKLVNKVTSLPRRRLQQTNTHAPMYTFIQLISRETAAYQRNTEHRKNKIKKKQQRLSSRLNSIC
jgi:hypothetical protein